VYIYRRSIYDDDCETDERFRRKKVLGGCQFMREGKQHSLYINRQTKKSAAVPRHREIPREQFEAFAALLEFRRRSEAFRNV
jgi:predicted Ser/Thr protein kinase